MSELIKLCTVTPDCPTAGELAVFHARIAAAGASHAAAMPGTTTGPR